MTWPSKLVMESVFIICDQRRLGTWVYYLYLQGSVIIHNFISLIGYTIIFIKAMLKRKIFFMITQIAICHNSRMISLVALIIPEVKFRFTDTYFESGIMHRCTHPVWITPDSNPALDAEQTELGVSRMPSCARAGPCVGVWMSSAPAR